MAKTKRRYRRYRKGVKWSSNLQEFSANVTASSTGVQSNSTTLCTSPAQSESLTTQVFTVKNFELTFTFDTTETQASSDIEDICAYIMYVPQGMNITNDYNVQHPEYILNYKYIGSPTTDDSQNYQPYKLRSRLARKLNSGDRIVLFVKFLLQSGTGTPMQIHGIVRWWTKAN